MTLRVGPIKDFVKGIYDGPHATPKEAEDGPIFLGIKNVTPEGRLDFSEIRHVSPEEFPRWTRRVTPQADDIVFSYEATLHRYALIPEGFVGCLGRRMALIRPDKSKLHPRFLHYYLLSSAWREKVETSIISGATVDRIPLTRVPGFEVAVPSLAHQERIADVLAAYDDLIENNRRRIELLEEAARQLYKEWFVRFRFPGHEHVKIIDGVPEGWERLPASIALNINPAVSIERESPITYVPMASLSESGMTVDASAFEIRTKHTSVKFRNGDTLFARITPCLENGKTCYVNFLGDDKPGCGSTEFIVLRGARVSSEFTYLLSRDEEFRGNAIKSMIGSSGRQRVQPSCFDRYHVPIAPNSLQRQFSEIVEPIFSQIGVLVQQTQQLARSRDLLLPRLMSGEIAA